MSRGRSQGVPQKFHIYVHGLDALRQVPEQLRVVSFKHLQSLTGVAESEHEGNRVRLATGAGGE